MPFIQVNDIKMFYRVFRDEREVFEVNPKLDTMIVLHGAPGILDHQAELRAWKLFSNLVQIVFLDQRGCGQTEDGDLKRWSIQQCGQDLYDFAKTLNLDAPIFAGVSMGGFAVMFATFIDSQYPKAIILCNTEARKSTDARKQEFLRLGSQKVAEAVAYFDESPWEEERLKVFFDVCAPYISKTQYDWLPAAKTNLAVWAQFAKEWNVMDLREGLKTCVQCPTLILAGEDDPNHPIACAIETANCIQKQYLHFDPIKRAGAPVYQDQPEAFRQRVTQFLQSLR